MAVVCPECSYLLEPVRRVAPEGDPHPEVIMLTCPQNLGGCGYEREVDPDEAAVLGFEAPGDGQPERLDAPSLPATEPPDQDYQPRVPGERMKVVTDPDDLLAALAVDEIDDLPCTSCEGTVEIPYVMCAIEECDLFEHPFCLDCGRRHDETCHAT